MRIGRLIASVALIILSVSGFAVAGPKISFEKESHDYGRVLSGETVTEEFTLTNIGDETLIVEKLRSSCGCTKAVKGSREVPPNGKTKIVAAFDTTGFSPGRKIQTVYVHTNDPNTPVAKLKLLADIVREITVEPSSIAKQLPAFVDTVTIPMKIGNSSKKPCTVKGVKFPKDGLSARLKPASIVVDPDSTVPFELEMNLTKEPGRHYYMGKLLLVIDHPREPEIEIRYLIKFAKTE
ncbi:MAG: DUF1573 domain-containing protein [Desulfomonilaceae bacterium]|nr:DUF1573 domain-containing protein [Desulfomonilaceae bacterium]